MIDLHLLFTFILLGDFLSVSECAGTAEAKDLIYPESETLIDRYFFFGNCHYFKPIGSPFLFKRNKGHSNSPQQMEGFQRKQRDRPCKIKKILTLQQWERLSVFGGGLCPRELCASLLRQCRHHSCSQSCAKAEKWGIGAGSRGRLKPLPAAVVGKTKPTALDLHVVSGLLLLCRSGRLHAALSSGCCVKPVLLAGIHPLAVEIILHPCGGTRIVIWGPHPIPPFALGLCLPLARPRK